MIRKRLRIVFPYCDIYSRFSLLVLARLLLLTIARTHLLLLLFNMLVAGWVDE